jgi:ATP-binding cassette subfamily G (WHITE) protein 2 (SNQ2)
LDEKLAQSGSTFTWRNIHYTVPHQNGEKQLLRNVSGYCAPGTLTALVGASGAGKSTRKSRHPVTAFRGKRELTQQPHSTHSSHPTGYRHGHG